MTAARWGTVALWIGAAGCASHAVRTPGDVRGYEIIVEGRDTLSRAFARALTDAGLRVRAAPRGGTRPAAALVHFVFREGPETAPLLYARLSDTRTGRVVAAAEQPLDSTVTALVRLLLTPTP